jgi:hypothetical protein
VFIRFNGIKTAAEDTIREPIKIRNMSGRGDNNKRGSAGRGNSNQSNQGFKDANAGKSTHNKHAEEGKPSTPQKKEPDQSSDRNQSVEGERE